MKADALVFRLLLSVTLLSPLPFASNRPWAWSLLAVLVGILLVVWSYRVATGKSRVAVPFARLWPVAVPFGLVLGWAAMQTSSAMPEHLWHPMWGEAFAALGRTPPTGAISVDPGRTATAILRLASYAGIFWLAVQLGRDRALAREAMIAFCAAETVYALYGLIVHFSGWENILWFPKWAYPHDLTATFVNRNAYGAYAGLGVLSCIGLFIHSLRPSRTGGNRGAYDVVETLLLRALPYLACGLIVGTALLLSHSRGAFLSTGLSLGVLLLLLAVAGVMRPRVALPMVAAILLLGLLAVTVSGDGTITRLAEETSVDQETQRTSVYRLTLQAIADGPYTGFGLGAFQAAFRMYRDTALPDPLVWEYAHNIPLETAMDLGIPGATLLALCFVAIAAAGLRGLSIRRRDRIYPILAVASTVLIGAHGLVDFSAQIPAVAAGFALLLGLGYTQSWSSEAKSGTETDGATG